MTNRNATGRPAGTAARIFSALFGASPGWARRVAAAILAAALLAGAPARAVTVNLSELLDGGRSGSFLVETPEIGRLFPISLVFDPVGIAGAYSLSIQVGPAEGPRCCDVRWGWGGRPGTPVRFAYLGEAWTAISDASPVTFRSFQSHPRYISIQAHAANGPFQVDHVIRVPSWINARGELINQPPFVRMDVWVGLGVVPVPLPAAGWMLLAALAAAAAVRRRV